MEKLKKEFEQLFTKNATEITACPRIRLYGNPQELWLWILNNFTPKVSRVELPVGMPPLQLNEIYNGDSFELCKRVPAKTVDLILEDMPYNTTQNDFEYEVDLELYWETRLRVLKPTGVIILTATQPLVSKLVLTNSNMFKYDQIWEKTQPTGFLNAKKMPLRYYETILVFYDRGIVYNPILRDKPKFNIRPRHSGKEFANNGNYGEFKHGDFREIDIDKSYPSNILKFENPQGRIHPTEKPVGLFEYLIRTYTNEGDLVFDGFGGSGTTAIAAHKSKRNFIVIEKEKKYFELAKRRLDNERAQLTML